MISIYVCEDSKEQRDRICKYITNYIMVENLDMSLALSCEDPHEIIQHVKENKGENLYFLDIDLQHEMNGLSLAFEIRKLDSRGIIVFITTHSELTYLTFIYKVEAMDYIIKDSFSDIQSRIIDCINLSYERLTRENVDKRKKFQQRIDNKVINVYHDEIMFFESSHKMHKVVMHLDNRIVEFYGRLKDLESLGEDFCRCHNSFIVNKNNILEIDKKKKVIYMTNGEMCFASSRMIKLLLT